jgi:hypothetical protein
VIGGSIWPMPILNRHLTHMRFIGAHNMWYLRAWLTPSSARMCLQLAKVVVCFVRRKMRPNVLLRGSFISASSITLVMPASGLPNSVA